MTTRSAPTPASCATCSTRSATAWRRSSVTRWVAASPCSSATSSPSGRRGWCSWRAAGSGPRSTGGCGPPRCPARHSCCASLASRPVTWARRQAQRVGRRSLAPTEPRPEPDARLPPDVPALPAGGRRPSRPVRGGDRPALPPRSSADAPGVGPSRRRHPRDPRRTGPCRHAQQPAGDLRAGRPLSRTSRNRPASPTSSGRSSPDRRRLWCDGRRTPSGRRGRHDGDRRRARRQPPRLRGDAAHRAGRVGRARRSRRGGARAAPGRRARCHVHRHRRLLWPGGQRAADQARPAPVRRRHRDRHQGRADPARSGEVGAVRAPGAPAPPGRAEPGSPRRRAPRPLPAPPHRPAGPAGRPARRARHAAAGGQGRSHRAQRGLDPPARGGPGDHADRLGAEPLQPGQPAGRVVGRPLRRGPASRSSRGSRWRRATLARPGGPLDGAGARPRRQPVPAGAGLAAAPLAGDAAHPRHVERRPRRGQLARRPPSRSATRSTPPSPHRSLHRAATSSASVGRRLLRRR